MQGLKFCPCLKDFIFIKIKMNLVMTILLNLYLFQIPKVFLLLNSVLKYRHLKYLVNILLKHANCFRELLQ